MFKNTVNFCVWVMSLGGTLGLAMGSSQAAGPDEQIYHFIDPQGVPHFSNVPVDARYKPYQLGAYVVGAARSQNVYRPRAQTVPVQQSQPAPQTSDDADAFNGSHNDR